MSELTLDSDVQYLPKVGPRRALLLEKLGLRTLRDVLLYLPRDLLDLTELTDVDGLNDKHQQTVLGHVVDVDSRQLSRGRTLTAAVLQVGKGYVRGVWFNQGWVLKRLHQLMIAGNGEDNLLWSGKPTWKDDRWQFNHPRMQVIDPADASEGGGLLPKYGLTEGLSMDELRRITSSAADLGAGLLEDSVPEAERAEWGLPRLDAAVRELHTPESVEAHQLAKSRIVHDDLFEFQLALALRRRYLLRTARAPKLPLTAKIDARIRRLLPFELTAGQNRAIEEICRDLATEASMHRLLQADVGAGKTVVAFHALLVAVAHGYQAVIMAPTEILARQHWEFIDSTLANSRVERCFLTGGIGAAERKRALDDIASGRIQLIVGTHAVIQQDVNYHNLGLVVIDEQHRFGVMQRSQFGESRHQPHMLVMTATPIPRSLCLTRYGDLDLSVIKELPPGRQTVVSSLLRSHSSTQKAWEFWREQLSKGRQGYVVCPRIDRDDEGLLSVESVFARLKEHELRDNRLGVLHGRMSSEEQADVLESFVEGEIDVLVATTIVEVGVDIPNATLMMIMDAGQFGLSQIHQLRGRVCRGKFRGYCFLYAPNASEDALERLRVLEQSSDGFRIAEADFELRGPGDLLGTRQHGSAQLKHADLKRDGEMLEVARERAFAMVESQRIDDAECRSLKMAVIDRYGESMGLPRTG